MHIPYDVGLFPMTQWWYEFIRQQDGIVSSREVRVGQNLQNAQQKHDLERADNHDLARNTSHRVKDTLNPFMFYRGLSTKTL